MRNRLITSVLAVAAVAVAMVTAACGSMGNGQAVTYAPAAYGQNGQCYYINSPAEAQALEQAGLCPAGWVATPMPLSWEQEYYAYYDSPAYYNSYVPVRYRTVYVHTESAFGTRYRTSITTLSSKATYRSSAGSTVHGYKSGTVRFGSGTSFGSTGQQYGGGNLRNHSTPAAGSTKYSKQSGTNLRQTGTGTRTGTGTGTRSSTSHH